MATIIRRKGLGMSSCKGIAECSRTGIKWVRNDTAPLPDDDLYIRWGCTSNLPRGPKQRVLNTAGAIHRVADKLGFRRILQENGGLCPKTWFSQYEPDLDPRGNHAAFPVILRTKTHHQGRGLWKVHNPKWLRNKCDELGAGHYYINELIDKVAEYRVFVVSGRAVCVAEKTPGNPEDVAWNVAKGGRFDNVRWGNWPTEAVRKSIDAFMLSGLDFGGVDVMVDGDGRSYILEINSAPSLTSPYRQQCMAKAFDYIVENGKEMIPMDENIDSGWRGVAHPAVREGGR